MWRRSIERGRTGKKLQEGLRERRDRNRGLSWRGAYDREMFLRARTFGSPTAKIEVEKVQSASV